MRKLSNTLSLVNSHQLSCNSCSRLTRTWELIYYTKTRIYFIQKLACKLSCNSCSRLTRTWELRQLLYKLSLINSHQLSCNSCSRLTRKWELIYYTKTRIYIIQKLACKLSCNSCSRLTRTWELRKLLYKLSLINSHQLSCNSCSRLTRIWELIKIPTYFKSGPVKTADSSLDGLVFTSQGFLITPNPAKWYAKQIERNVKIT